METVEVVIVGGGPAGSTCAWALQRAGVDCLVLDKARFPRTKLCAGWITPDVVQDLEIEIGDYPHRFLTFERMHFHFPWIGFTSTNKQHSIRRYEFDAWLLERTGAEFRQHEVRKIRRQGQYYIIDETFCCSYLVGAGGTRCPVYRNGALHQQGLDVSEADSGSVKPTRVADNFSRITRSSVGVERHFHPLTLFCKRM